jgi:hypothetical protein
MEDPDDETAIPSVVAATHVTDPTSVDALLAQELTGLTIQERHQVLEEIHGVVSHVVEDPSFVAQCLAQLETTLHQSSSTFQQQPSPVQHDNHYGDETLSTMAAYWQAHALNPTYTTNVKFRLQFLRAERFNVATTAQRMGRYFQQKLILFGPDKLGQAQITWKDLSVDDQVAVECGYMQWLPQRDSAGRAIYFCAILLRQWKERSNLVSGCWLVVAVVDLLWWWWWLLQDVTLWECMDFVQEQGINNAILHLIALTNDAHCFSFLPPSPHPPKTMYDFVTVLEHAFCHTQS